MENIELNKKLNSYWERLLYEASKRALTTVYFQKTNKNNAKT